MHPLAALAFPLVSFALILAVALVLLRAPRRAAAPAVAPAVAPRSAAVVISASPATHSPRALAHAHALLASRAVHLVFLVAHAPAPPAHAGLRFVPLAAPAARARGALPLAIPRAGGARALLHALRRARAHGVRVVHVVLNTPPALPALPALLAMRPLLYARPWPLVTLDVHNTAASIMRTTGALPSALVVVAEWAEMLCARAADRHLTVSRALADYLEERIAVRPTVVYDRPRPEFRAAMRARAREAGGVMRRARETSVCLGAPWEEGVPTVVTSTSWTPDEDFEMLSDALQLLEARGRRVHVVVTGKGPLRAAFEACVEACKFKRVGVWLVWLSADDYPRMLAAASVGVSLHASSSGLDLPMKVVDMLGCGLPVLALRYASIGELVVEGTTGTLFDDAEGLANGLERLLGDESERERMRERVVELFNREGMMWQEGWERDALPVLLGKEGEGRPA